MNKLFLVMLAVCLVSAHAFVKREAPDNKPEDTFVKQAKDAAEAFGKKVTETLNNFDSEKLQAEVKKFMDDATKALADLGKKSEAPTS